MKKACLVVSFGVRNKESRERTITTFEKELQNAYPDLDVFGAFSSTRIINKIKRVEGIAIDDPKSAIERIKTEGYKELIILPFYLISGDTHLDLLELVKVYEEGFTKITVLSPFLHENVNYDLISAIITEDADVKDSNEGLLFVGHGTDSSAQLTYEALSHSLEKLSFPAFFGTIKSTLTFEKVVAQLKAESIRHVMVRPFLMTQGYHVTEDIKEVWGEGLQKEGFEVNFCLKPLGDYSVIRQHFMEKLQEYLDEGS